MSIYQNIYFNNSLFSSIVAIGRNLSKFIFGAERNNQTNNENINIPNNIISTSAESTDSENNNIIEVGGDNQTETNIYENNPTETNTGEENLIDTNEENPTEIHENHNNLNLTSDATYNGITFFDSDSTWRVVPDATVPIRKNPTIPSEIIRFSVPNEYFFAKGVSFCYSKRQRAQVIQWILINQEGVPRFVNVYTEYEFQCVVPIWNFDTNTKNNEIIHKPKKIHILRSLLGNGRKYINNKLYGLTNRTKVNESDGHVSTKNDSTAKTNNTSESHSTSDINNIKSHNASDTELNDMECCICCNPINEKIVLVPCGHIRFCLGCINQLPNKKCPICTQVFEKYYRIFD
jgi:hypothetical protein